MATKLGRVVNSGGSKCKGLTCHQLLVIISTVIFQLWFSVILNFPDFSPK